MFIYREKGKLVVLKTMLFLYELGVASLCMFILRYKSMKKLCVGKSERGGGQSDAEPGMHDTVYYCCLVPVDYGQI